MCPQLVVKTKYTDTLIKLLLTLRGLSGCIRRLIARKSPKRIFKKNNIIIMIIIIWSRSCLSDSMAFVHYARIIFASILVRQKH